MADLSEWVLDTLRASAEITGLLVDGAAGVIESGDLSPEDLKQAQQRRRDLGPSGAGLLLALLVMDTGERRVGEGRGVFCSVFIYDRNSGYGNIRAMRDVVIDTLVGQPVTLDRDALVVALQYASRSGHLNFDDFDLDFERVDFLGPLVAEESYSS